MLPRHNLVHAISDQSSEEKKLSPKSSTSRSSSQEPPRKKSRLLGNVDINSEEVKAILKARSKHQGAVMEVTIQPISY